MGTMTMAMAMAIKEENPMAEERKGETKNN
jgi:hypothetical protein